MYMYLCFIMNYQFLLELDALLLTNYASFPSPWYNFKLIWFRSLDEEINHSRKTGACPGNLELIWLLSATDRAGLKYIPNFILGSQEPGSDQLLINMQMVWFLAESDYC